MEDYVMANLTKAQREAKEKLEAEKLADSEEVVVEEVVEEKVEEVKEVEKPKKTAPVETKKEKVEKLQDEDMVLVASYASGLTKLVNPEKPFDEYQWEKFGLTEEVRYGTLEQMKRKNGNDLFTKFIYVLDERAVAQLGLTKLYSELKSPVELDKVINLDLDHAIKFIEGSNASTKVVLREILIGKIQNKENINAFNLMALAEKLDIQLDTINFK